MSRFCYFLFFASAIFCHLLSSSNVNARAFSAHVVHRHSPKHSSNSKQSSKSKIGDYQVFNGSRLPVKYSTMTRPEDNGIYLMELAVGTPPVKQYGLIDFASELIWFRCTSCLSSKCYPQDVPMLDPFQSSTYAYFPCFHPICTQKQSFLTTCGVSQIPECIYSLAYATPGSMLQGFLSTDTISLSKSWTSSSIQNIVFGCGYHNEDGGGLSRNTAGIIGLNRGPLSLVTQLGVKQFSYCLPDPSSNVPGSITFGDVGPKSDKGVVTTPLIKRPNSDFYYVNLEGASVAGKTIKNNQGNSSVAVKRIKNSHGNSSVAGKRTKKSHGNSSSTDHGNIFLDSGSELNYLEPRFYHSLEAAVKNATSLTPADVKVPWYNLCYNEFPKDIEVVFHFKGANVTLKPVNMFVKVADFVCFSMVPAEGATHALIGNVAQRNFQIIKGVGLFRTYIKLLSCLGFEKIV